MLAGEKQCSIAKALVMSDRHLRRVLKSPVFQDHLKELREQADRESFDLLKFMRAHTLEAIESIVATLRDQNAPPRDRRFAAKKILNLAGFGR